jgi:uncharacterized membrane protein HdeD (DUF308 family)
MATLLKKGWWILLVRGIAAVLFGVVALVWPRLTVGTLILYFGVFALVAGISDVIGSIVNRKEDQYWWVVLLGGLVSIVAGVLVFVWPRLTALFLLYMIAASTSTTIRGSSSAWKTPTISCSIGTRIPIPFRQTSWTNRSTI